jgi:hypothetical protein
MDSMMPMFLVIYAPRRLQLHAIPMASFPCLAQTRADKPTRFFVDQI